MWKLVLLIIGVIIIGIICLVVYGYIYGKKQNAVNELVQSENNEAFNPKEIVSYSNMKDFVYNLFHYIDVDVEHKLWRINRSWCCINFSARLSNEGSPIYEFADLRDFELLEKSGEKNMTATTTSTTAPSLTTVILGGDVKNTYSKTQINTVEYSEPIIRISFKDLSVPDQRISFPKVQKGSFEYKQEFEHVQQCLSLLRKIKAYNEENNPTQRVDTNTEQALSVADELKKLKSLLDEGIIT